MLYLRNLLQALDLDSLQAALTRICGILICLTIHETCHGLVAYAMGDPTAKRMHRLSFNPLRHIDWLGLGMMFLAGFGWAKPVPVDPRYFKKPKLGMAVTALAGPVSNILLTIWVLIICKVIYLCNPAEIVWAAVFQFLLGTLAPLSVGLGVFNLLPFPPLDGSKLVAALLPDRYYAVWMCYERHGILVLLAISYFGLADNFIGNMIFGVYEVLFNLVF